MAERRRRRLEISRQVAAEQGVPEDLDSDVVDPHAIPDTARRRRAGVVYLIAAVVTAAGILAGLPEGMWVLVGVLAMIGGYHFVAGWSLRVREGRALEEANRVTAFMVGHASAQLGFEGWRARPVWNVLVFSADDPPSERGLVRVDGIDGHVIDSYVEPVPPADRPDPA